MGCHTTVLWIILVLHRSSCQAAHWIEGFGTSPCAVWHGKRNCSGARIQPRYGAINWYEVLIGALQGMAFVHRLGFAHRDLKSQNVLYDIDSGRAKVLQRVWHVCLTLCANR